jgi:hypothetical protein
MPICNLPAEDGRFLGQNFDPRFLRIRTRIAEHSDGDAGVALSLEELDRTGKETVEASYFQVLIRHFSRKTEAKYEKSTCR